jgi:hypothetical protein
VVDLPFFNKCAVFFNGFGVCVVDFWIRSKTEYKSIEGFGFGLTPNPDKDLDLRPNPKDSVKSNTLTAYNAFLCR